MNALWQGITEHAATVVNRMQSNCKSGGTGQELLLTRVLGAIIKPGLRMDGLSMGRVGQLWQRRTVPGFCWNWGVPAGSMGLNGTLCSFRVRKEAIRFETVHPRHSVFIPAPDPSAGVRRFSEAGFELP